MKKCLLAFIVLMSISALAYIAAGCVTPNSTYTVVSGPLPSGTSVTCCGVGDGSVLSCTNGSMWFNATEV